MSCALTIPLSDLRIVHESLAAEEARRLKALVRAVADFEAAEDKAAFVAAARPALESLGVRGVSVPSMYRKAALLRANGWRGLLDGRLARRMRGPGGLAANAEFRDFWHALALSNRRKTAPAYIKTTYLSDSGQEENGPVAAESVKRLLVRKVANHQ